MPSTPYAKLLVSLNAGPTQSGGITASPGDTVQLTAESTAQWDLTTPPKWEIYAFPPGWTGPASGWTTESAPQPGGGSADIYVYLGLGPPPSFVLPALPDWGKFLMRLTVNGGLSNGLADSTLIDNTTALQTFDALNLEDVAVQEEGQFYPAGAYVRSIQNDLRIINTSIAAISPYTLTPVAVTSAAGSAGVSALFSRGDHSHQLTFATLNNVLGTASAPISINGQTLTSGGFIGPYYSTSAASPATTGLLRGAHNSVLVASRDSADATDAPLISFGVGTNDLLTIGGGGVAQLRANVGTAGWTYDPTNGFLFDDACSASMTFLATAAAAGKSTTIEAQAGTTQGGDMMISAGDSPGTVGVVKIRTYANDSGVAGEVQFLSDSTEYLGIVNTSSQTTLTSTKKLVAFTDIAATLAPILSAGASGDLRAADRVASVISTADATPTIALAYTIAASTVAFVKATIVALADTGDASVFEIRAGVKRTGGGATLIGSSDIFAREDNAATHADITVAGNDVQVEVTGIALTGIEWFSTMNVTLMTP